jgi:hypothetical protein
MKNTIVVLALSMAASAAPAGAGSDVTVSVNPQLALEPGFTNVMVRVERNAENRELRIEADGPEYFRSSAQQLDGEMAPLTSQIKLDGIPSGRYVVRAVVVRADGSQVEAVETLVVVATRPK